MPFTWEQWALRAKVLFCIMSFKDCTCLITYTSPRTQWVDNGCYLYGANNYFVIFLQVSLIPMPTEMNRWVFPFHAQDRCYILSCILLCSFYFELTQTVIGVGPILGACWYCCPDVGPKADQPVPLSVWYIPCSPQNFSNFHLDTSWGCLVLSLPRLSGIDNACDATNLHKWSPVLYKQNFWHLESNLFDPKVSYYHW